LDAKNNLVAYIKADAYKKAIAIDANKKPIDAESIVKPIDVFVERQHIPSKYDFAEVSMPNGETYPLRIISPKFTWNAKLRMARDKDYTDFNRWRFNESNRLPSLKRAYNLEKPHGQSQNQAQETTRQEKVNSLLRGNLNEETIPENAALRKVQSRPEIRQGQKGRIEEGRSHGPEANVNASVNAQDQNGNEQRRQSLLGKVPTQEIPNVQTTTTGERRTLQEPNREALPPKGSNRSESLSRSNRPQEVRQESVSEPEHASRLKEEITSEHKLWKSSEPQIAQIEKEHQAMSAAQQEAQTRITSAIAEAFNSKERLPPHKMNLEGVKPEESQTYKISAPEEHRIREFLKNVLGKNTFELLIAKQTEWSGRHSFDPFNMLGAIDLIEIADNAKDPQGVAYHEALHAFFRRLLKNGKSSTVDLLQKVATNEYILDQLREFYSDQPAVIKAIEENPEEAVAYAFQRWALNDLSLAPKPHIEPGLLNAIKHFFTELLQLINQLRGKLSDEVKAERIFQEFFGGNLASDEQIQALDQFLNPPLGDRLKTEARAAALKAKAVPMIGTAMENLVKLSFASTAAVKGIRMNAGKGKTSNAIMEIWKVFASDPGDPRKHSPFHTLMRKLMSEYSLAAEDILNELPDPEAGVEAKASWNRIVDALLGETKFGHDELLKTDVKVERTKKGQKDAAIDEVKLVNSLRTFMQVARDSINEKFDLGIPERENYWMHQIDRVLWGRNRDKIINALVKAGVPRMNANYFWQSIAINDPTNPLLEQEDMEGILTEALTAENAERLQEIKDEQERYQKLLEDEGSIAFKIFAPSDRYRQQRTLPDSVVKVLLPYMTRDPSLSIHRWLHANVKRGLVEHFFSHWNIKMPSGGESALNDPAVFKDTIEEKAIEIMRELIESDSKRGTLKQAYGRTIEPGTTVYLPKRIGKEYQDKLLREIRWRVRKTWPRGGMDFKRWQSLVNDEAWKIYKELTPRDFYDATGRITEAVKYAASYEEVDVKDINYFKDKILMAELGRLGLDIHPAWRATQGYLQFAFTLPLLSMAVLSSLAEMAQIDSRMQNRLLNSKVLNRPLGSIRTTLKMVMAKEGRDKLRDLQRVLKAQGVINESLLESTTAASLEQEYMDPRIIKYSAKFFKWTGLKAWTDLTRKIAWKLGEDAIEEYYRIAMDETESEQARKEATAQLAELTLKPKDLAKWVDATPQERMAVGKFEKIKMAHAIFVDQATLRPGPESRPVWASDPRFQILWALNDFPWAMWHTTLRRLELQSRRTNPGWWNAAMPWLMVAPAFLILGAVGTELRRLIQNLIEAGTAPMLEELGIHIKPRAERSSAMMAEQWVDRSGLLGPYQKFIQIYQGSQYPGVALVDQAGPTVGLLQDIILNGWSEVPRRILSVGGGLSYRAKMD
jgi:hypothetical protein